MSTSKLADVVLPLIRTRADLHRWSAANAHGQQMHEAIDILEDAVPTSDPAEVYAVTHKALASAIKVIAARTTPAGSSETPVDGCSTFIRRQPRLRACRLADSSTG